MSELENVKYIILLNEEITQDLLDSLDDTTNSIPKKIWEVEPDLESGESGTLSAYSYVTTEKKFPKGFSGFKKLDKEAFDSAVSDIRSDRFFQHKNTNKVSIEQIDTDTGGLKISPKFAPTGWMQRLHEIEFTTSTVGGAIHDKDYLNQDTGWSSVEFYEDVGGVETLMVSPSQADLDAKCIRTDFKWMPDVDYMILSAMVSQIDVPKDDQDQELDVYMWGLFVDLDAIYGGPQIEILGGGLNLKYLDSRSQLGIRGVAGTIVYYDKIVQSDGSEIALPPGSGTNRARIIIRHPVGFKHRLQAIYEIFRS